MWCFHRLTGRIYLISWWLHILQLPSGFQVESLYVSMDPQLPQDNGNFTGTRDEKGLTGHQQALK